MMELHARWKVAFKYLFGKQKTYFEVVQLFPP